MAFLPRANSRVRSLAYRPLLDNAIRAADPMRFHAQIKVKPLIMTECRRQTRLVSKTDLAQVNSTSYGSQTAYGGSPSSSPAYPSSSYRDR